MTNTAAGCDDIARVSGDDVHVEVRHCLATCLADIHTEIEAIGRMPSQNRRVCDSDRGRELLLLLMRGVEPGAHVPLRHEQRVTGGNREGIPNPDHALTGVEDALGLWSAEGAGRLDRCGAVELGHRGVPISLALYRRTSSLPSSPASTHAAHRHCQTVRRAVHRR